MEKKLDIETRISARIQQLAVWNFTLTFARMSLIWKNFKLQRKNEFGLVFIFQKIPVIQTFVKRKVGVLHRTNFKLVLRTWQLNTVTEAIIFYILTHCKHKVDVYHHSHNEDFQRKL